MAGIYKASNRNYLSTGTTWAEAAQHPALYQLGRYRYAVEEDRVRSTGSVPGASHQHFDSTLPDQ